MPGQFQGRAAFVFSACARTAAQNQHRDVGAFSCLHGFLYPGHFFRGRVFRQHFRFRPILVHEFTALGIYYIRLAVKLRSQSFKHRNGFGPQWPVMKMSISGVVRIRTDDGDAFECICVERQCLAVSPERGVG